MVVGGWLCGTLGGRVVLLGVVVETGGAGGFSQFCHWMARAGDRVASCFGIQVASSGSMVDRVEGSSGVVGMASADVVKSSADVAVKAACVHSRNWVT